MAKKKRSDDEAQAESSDGSIAVNDAWTGMLAVSLAALVIGSGFLFYDYLQYTQEELPTLKKVTSTPPGPAPKPPPPKVDPVKDAAPKDAGEK